MRTHARTLLWIVLIGAVALVAPEASAQRQRSFSSPLVGIVEGQRAHLTLAHVGAGRRASTRACEATLAFVDDQARVLKQQHVRLAPGHGTFLALDWTEAPPADRGRLHYRAVFTPLTESCEGAITGHEMVDIVTQKTTVFIGVYLE